MESAETIRDQREQDEVLGVRLKATAQPLTILGIAPWRSLWSMGKGAGATAFMRSPVALAAAGHRVHVVHPCGPNEGGTGRYGGVRFHRYRAPEVFSNPDLPLPLRLFERAWRYGYYHLRAPGQALRVAAAKRPELFREILEVSLENFQHERQSYQISADPAEPARLMRQLPEEKLVELLDNRHARQVLHVGFGAVLRADGGRLGRRLRKLLWQYEQLHYQLLAEHLRRHIAPFDEAMKGESPDVQ